MTAGDWLMVAIAVVATIAAAVLAAAEAALMLMTPKRAERMVAEGAPGAAAIQQFVEDPAPEMTVTHFLRSLCEVSATVLVVAVIFDSLSAGAADIWVSILLMVVVAFIAWGVAPRTLGQQHAERVAGWCVRPLSVVATVLWPMNQLLIWIANAITPGRGYTDGPFIAEAEKIAEASEGEREMINSVFELGDTITREVMVPRTDIVWIAADKTLRQGLSLGLRSGFSRIPVAGEDLDDVVGIVYLKDLMKRIFDHPEAERRETVASVMRPAHFTPDSKPVDDLLKEMQVTRNHLSIVIDEFGGTAGLVSIEDTVEEIVGEITDEYDAEPDLVEEIEPGKWRVSARMSIDDMSSLFGLDLDDEDVETIGGLMAKELNRVPIPGAHISWNGLEITAEKTTARRHQIDTVLVSRATTGEGAVDDQSTE
ncbi:hypothetical protein HMPREF1531_02553 [Propionibacterium sp. oral taxon 192 str. F0372]|uniref:hemolysin family protein n=1 Tax=Propionibacterium sp. oral taxon 192 TaxID=671222 RepID=UPI000352FF21|nr:hemolysin family protein [Propionibacterium sp. oral taxon 192]EPH00441.1 hypothetical protein HMPREF1531_02553 [Propionibacterium sp. oral taxon 192 str. F0372]